MNKIEHSVASTLQTLEQEERKLFSTYNRHAQPEIKLEHLNKLTLVISKIQVLKQIK